MKLSFFTMLRPKEKMIRHLMTIPKRQIYFDALDHSAQLFEQYIRLKLLQGKNNVYLEEIHEQLEIEIEKVGTVETEFHSYYLKTLKTAALYVAENVERVKINS